MNPPMIPPGGETIVAQLASCLARDRVKERIREQLKYIASNGRYGVLLELLIETLRPEDRAVLLSMIPDRPFSDDLPPSPPHRP